jgi:quinohemoprotein ethanol dehydrogenase
LDVLYIGTGNGAPWNRKIRSPDGGDNLFLCSIVALKPDTGEYLWHYQTTPGETWDYNSNMDIVLANLTVGGEQIKAILHAPKNGFFYVINRKTGKLVSAERFADTTWASHIDLATGRPVEIPGARYETGPALITPNLWGAHNWQAMSYSPLTGLAYIPTIHQASVYFDEGIDLATWQAEEFLGGLGVKLRHQAQQPRPYPGSLQAWDPVRQKQAWSVPQDHFWNAGTLVTAGNLVFQGRADGKLVAYHAGTGAVTWTFDLGLGISAPPITYRLNGRQYLALLVGWGGGAAGLGDSAGWAYGIHRRRLVAFALDGEVKLPEQPAPYFPQPLVISGFKINPDLVEQGERLWGRCGACHGRGVVAGGMAPDLRASAVPLAPPFFEQIVRDGSKVNRGMPAYPDLTRDDLLALQHYIRESAHRPPAAPQAQAGGQ